MFFALVYLLLHRVLWLIAGSSNELVDTEVEVVALRHQPKVLKGQVFRELGGRRSSSGPTPSFGRTGSW
jgi:hypothetical protein